MLVTRGLGRNANDNEFLQIPMVSFGIGLISVAKKPIVNYNYDSGGYDFYRANQIAQAKFKSKKQEIEEEDLFIIIKTFLNIKNRKK